MKKGLSDANAAKILGKYGIPVTDKLIAALKEVFMLGVHRDTMKISYKEMKDEKN